jgi:hypothetical protein
MLAPDGNAAGLRRKLSVRKQRLESERLPDEGFVVEPNAVMRVHTLARKMGIKNLSREVRTGRLRVHRIANRYYALGSDILKWIENAPSNGRSQRIEANGVHSP